MVLDPTIPSNPTSLIHMYLQVNLFSNSHMYHAPWSNFSNSVVNKTAWSPWYWCSIARAT